MLQKGLSQKAEMGRGGFSRLKEMKETFLRVETFFPLFARGKASSSFPCAMWFHRQNCIAYGTPPKKENGVPPLRESIKIDVWGSVEKASRSPDLEIQEPPSTGDCTPLLSC